MVLYWFLDSLAGNCAIVSARAINRSFSLVRTKIGCIDSIFANKNVEKLLVSFELKNKNFGRVKSLIICRKRSCRYHAAPPEKIKYFQCLNCKNIFILLAIHQLLFQNFQNSMYANVD